MKSIKEIAEAELAAAEKALGKASEKVDGKDGKAGLAAKATKANEALRAAQDEVRVAQARVDQKRNVVKAIKGLDDTGDGTPQGVEVPGIESQESVQAV